MASVLGTSVFTFVTLPSEDYNTGGGRGQEVALDRKDSVWQAKLHEVVAEAPGASVKPPDSAHSFTPPMSNASSLASSRPFLNMKV